MQQDSERLHPQPIADALPPLATKSEMRQYYLPFETAKRVRSAVLGKPEITMLLGVLQKIHTTASKSPQLDLRRFATVFGSFATVFGSLASDEALQGDASTSAGKEPTAFESNHPGFVSNFENEIKLLGVVIDILKNQKSAFIDALLANGLDSSFGIDADIVLHECEKAQRTLELFAIPELRSFVHQIAQTPREHGQQHHLRTVLDNLATFAGAMQFETRFAYASSSEQLENGLAFILPHDPNNPRPRFDRNLNLSEKWIADIVDVYLQKPEIYQPELMRIWQMLQEAVASITRSQEALMEEIEEIGNHTLWFKGGGLNARERLQKIAARVKSPFFTNLSTNVAIEQDKVARSLKNPEYLRRMNALLNNITEALQVKTPQESLLKYPRLKDMRFLLSSFVSSSEKGFVLYDGPKSVRSVIDAFYEDVDVDVDDVDTDGAVSSGSLDSSRISTQAQLKDQDYEQVKYLELPFKIHKVGRGPTLKVYLEVTDSFTVPQQSSGSGTDILLVKGAWLVPSNNKQKEEIADILQLDQTDRSAFITDLDSTVDFVVVSD